MTPSQGLASSTSSSRVVPSAVCCQSPQPVLFPLSSTRQRPSHTPGRGSGFCKDRVETQVTEVPTIGRWGALVPGTER